MSLLTLKLGFFLSTDKKLNLIYILLFFFLLFDPFGELQLKYLAFTLILIEAIRRNRGRINRHCLHNVFLHLFIVYYLVVISTVNNAFPREFYAVLNSFFVFSIFIALSLHKIFYAELVYAMGLLVIVNAAFFTIGILSVDYALWLYELLKPLKIISFEFAFDFPVLYHNSIFFCILGLPSLINSLWQGRVGRFFCIASFLLTFKKSIIIAVTSWFILSFRSVGWRAVIVLLICFTALYCVDLEILDSQGIRMGYLIRYYELLSDPEILFFGHGLTAVDWGNGLRAALIELTYFELVRYVGIFISALFMANLARVTLLTVGNPKYRLRGIGVMMFLISCAFNPFLWGLLGLPLIAIMIPFGEKLS